MERVAIVNANSFGRYYPKSIDDLKRNFEVERFVFNKDVDSSALVNELNEYNYIVVGTTPDLTSEFFDKVNGLKFVGRFGVGYDNVATESARNSGVLVSNIPAFTEKDDVAELAVTLTLDCLKRATYSYQKVIAGEWSVDRVRYLGNRVRGKTVGICGFGNIGKRYAEIMKFGFDCNIIFFDPFVSEKDNDELNAKKVEFDELITQSDVISIHMNATEDNIGIFNYEKLSNMKVDSVLVNCARGALVNESDIIKALDENKFAYYAADVLTKEPPLKDHLFLNHEKVLLTPHIGAYNMECNQMMCESIVDDIYKVSENQLPKHLVN